MNRQILTGFKLGLLTALLLALCGLAHADPPLSDVEVAPATPADFHARELQRYQRWSLTPAIDWDHPAEYDANYYALTVDVRNFAGHIITAQLDLLGTCVETSLSLLHFDLCNSLLVDSIRSAGTLCAFTHTNNQIEVTLEHNYTLGQSLELSVWYHGTPGITNGQWSFWYYTRAVGPAQVPAIHTLSEPYGARDWWPCKDTPGDKADSARIAIICADSLTATSNGVLESTVTLPGAAKRVTWFERHPIATYLITINVTNYRLYHEWYVAQGGDSVPLDHYTYPERYNQSVISWSPLPAMLNFLAQRFGEYPFADEKYGHSMNNFPGGMEHQCNSSIGRVITTGTRSYDYITVHEAMHQWFGDCVTLQDWPDVWLNEGFASYAEALWAEQAGGSDSLRVWMTNPNYNGVVDPSGPVYDPDVLFGSNTVYNKGSWILHMLRGVIRDDTLFWAVLREYRSRYAYTTATTADFLATASAVSGRDADAYLHAYLYRTNRPSYQVSFESGTLDGHPRTVVRVDQVQTNPDTTFRTRLDLSFDGGAQLRTVENAARSERYYLDLPTTPGTFALDPSDWILKNVTYLPSQLTILNDQLRSATVQRPYSRQFVAAGGIFPLAWSISSGTRPPGMFLSSAGLLNGTPTAEGSYDFTVRVIDNAAHVDSQRIALTVWGPLQSPQSLTIHAFSPQIVQLLWKSVSYADSFHIWRGTTPDMTDAQMIAVTHINSWTDSTATMPQVPDSLRIPLLRFYQVTAVRNE